MMPSYYLLSRLMYIDLNSSLFKINRRTTRAFIQTNLRDRVMFKRGENYCKIIVMLGHTKLSLKSPYVRNTVEIITHSNFGRNSEWV